MLPCAECYWFGYKLRHIHCLLYTGPFSRANARLVYSHMNKCSVTELHKLKLLTTHFFGIFTLLLINSLLS